MIIKYIHDAFPTEIKIYDTVKALKNNPWLHMTQKEFDKMALDKMESDKYVEVIEVIFGKGAK